MSRAVQFDQYGDVDVLQVVDVPDPVPGPGEVLVRVRATSINPGEAKIRDGSLHAMYPATFPSGEGSDLAGVVEGVGVDVTAFGPGDEVIGWTDSRAAHAELAVASVDNLTRKPESVSWEVAGSLYVAGCTGWAAVRAVSLSAGDTVARPFAQACSSRIAKLPAPSGGHITRRASVDLRGQAGLNRSEFRADRLADSRDHGHDRKRDPAGNQGIFDGSRTGLIREKS